MGLFQELTVGVLSVRIGDGNAIGGGLFSLSDKGYGV